MPGRPRKPTALKLLQGNPGKRALPKDEPRPPKGAVCPGWLGLKARTLWAEYAPRFEAMGCLTVADVPAFACWMIELAKIKWCEEHGKAVAVSVSKLAQSYAVQFGGTAAARSRVSVKPEKETDEFSELYGGG